MMGPASGRFYNGVVPPDPTPPTPGVVAEVERRRVLHAEARALGAQQARALDRTPSSRGALRSNFPNLNGFLERIHERPAYKRALDRGGPYALLG